MPLEVSGHSQRAKWLANFNLLLLGEAKLQHFYGQQLILYSTSVPKKPKAKMSCLKQIWTRMVSTTDLHIYNLDAVPPVHVVWNHVDTDKLTNANGGTFTSSSASLSNQSR